MTFKLWSFGLVAGLSLWAAALSAQEAKIAFGDLNQDTTLPVEVSADQFTVNNADGTAVFAGNVVVIQGEMQLVAAEMQVNYAPDQSAIRELIASGGVTITNLGDDAKADAAVYTIDSGMIVMTGNVLLSQGLSTMAGQKLTINLKDGSGIMEGRVTTTFVPGGN